MDRTTWKMLTHDLRTMTRGQKHLSNNYRRVRIEHGGTWWSVTHYRGRNWIAGPLARVGTHIDVRPSIIIDRPTCQRTAESLAWAAYYRIFRKFAAAREELAEMRTMRQPFRSLP